jgi:hypothetical protein
MNGIKNFSILGRLNSNCQEIKKDGEGWKISSIQWNYFGEFLLT